MASTTKCRGVCGASPRALVAAAARVPSDGEKPRDSGAASSASPASATYSARSPNAANTCGNTNRPIAPAISWPTTHRPYTRSLLLLVAALVMQSTISEPPPSAVTARSASSTAKPGIHSAVSRLPAPNSAMASAAMWRASTRPSHRYDGTVARLNAPSSTKK